MTFVLNTISFEQKTHNEVMPVPFAIQTNY